MPITTTATHNPSKLSKGHSKQVTETARAQATGKETAHGEIQTVNNGRFWFMNIE